MKFKDLALEICRREGKKKQVNIAQVNEILKVIIGIGPPALATLVYEMTEGQPYQAVNGLFADMIIQENAYLKDQIADAKDVLEQALDEAQRHSLYELRDNISLLLTQKAFKGSE